MENPISKIDSNLDALCEQIGLPVNRIKIFLKNIAVEKLKMSEELQALRTKNDQLENENKNLKANLVRLNRDVRANDNIKNLDPRPSTSADIPNSSTAAATPKTPGRPLRCPFFINNGNPQSVKKFKNDMENEDNFNLVVELLMKLKFKRDALLTFKLRRAFSKICNIAKSRSRINVNGLTSKDNISIFENTARSNDHALSVFGRLLKKAKIIDESDLNLSNRKMLRVAIIKLKNLTNLKGNKQETKKAVKTPKQAKPQDKNTDTNQQNISINLSNADVNEMLALPNIFQILFNNQTQITQEKNIEYN